MNYLSEKILYNVFFPCILKVYYKNINITKVP